MKYRIKAALIDLDGVITKTSRQHALSWKKVLDEFNSKRSEEGKPAFSSFEVDKDYSKYFNGASRYDGLSKFLSAKQVDLEQGSPGDEEGFNSICAIGNYKNRLFRELIATEGVEVFRENVEQIRKWRENGIKTAVISSSKNCKHVLQLTGLEELFEIRIDGIMASERNIPTKPAPDLFLEAADKLKVHPREALVVEDALAGIEAGRRGNFRLVIGVENTEKKEVLKEQGAHLVVKNLMELDLRFKKEKSAGALPSALDHFSELTDFFPSYPPLLFLDFDGTLSPIVEHHADAEISEEMRSLVQKLSQVYPVAVVSGRGLADVRKRVNLPEIFYAGSHGFEISGPNGFSKDHEGAVRVIPVFDEIEPVLRKKLSSIEGVDFERKKFTLAIHYRQVRSGEEKKVHEIVRGVLKDYPEVLKSDGKKVIEIRPSIDWHKGKAVEFLKRELSRENDAFSVYVGDDVTDEDAFRYVGNGIGILVGEHGQPTFADYRVESLEEVKSLFQKLLDHSGQSA